MIEIITISTKNDIHYNFDNCNFDRSKIVLHLFFYFANPKKYPNSALDFKFNIIHKQVNF